LYSPSFRGTTPELELIAGPEGMNIDNATSRLRWVPTNAQALEGMHPVIVRARNGAGTADQRFTVKVKNINDPPSAVTLLTPLDGNEHRFVGEDPVVTFSWLRSVDPDGDSLKYLLELDSVATFDSPAHLTVETQNTDSARVILPQVSRLYFWRVRVSDGEFTTGSHPALSHLAIVASRFLSREKISQVESVLEQNFPNPFNPSTSIKYVLPRGGHVRLLVFNLLGQEVANLFDGIQPEGTHEMGFTKANLPSGIYFYRLVAPGFVETKKMVIAR
jgi:hypothetical protein